MKVMAPVVVLTLVVPWAGATVTVTAAGFRAAPLAVTVSLASTFVVIAVFCGVVPVSFTAVTVFGTVIVTVADEQTAVGVEVSHTR